jgi:hypothetical protein
MVMVIHQLRSGAEQIDARGTDQQFAVENIIHIQQLMEFTNNIHTDNKPRYFSIGAARQSSLEQKCEIRNVEYSRLTRQNIMRINVLANRNYCH